MEKYREKLMLKISEQIDQWSHNSEEIKHAEVYQFLHTVTGTAGTIGLNDLSNVARNLMEKIDENSQRIWREGELETFLFDLISMCFHSESKDIIQNQPSRIFLGNEPLILIVDDDTSLLMMLKEELEKQGWFVHAIADPEKAVTAFYDHTPDCVIMDVYMKEKNGFQLLSFFQNTLKHQLVPKIMMSVDQQKQTKIKAYEIGADDFILKPFDIDELIVRVRRALERKELIDHLLLVDELTRVYNRKYLAQAFESNLSELKRENKIFSLAILDIDHFKKINDKYGHLVGDLVLKGFASFLQVNSRGIDTVIRFGGEEFIMILPGTNGIQARAGMERILKKIAHKNLVEKKDELISITFSAGIVEVNDPNIPLETWIELADQSLYEAKDAGRSQVRLVNFGSTHKHRKKIKVAIVDDDPIIRTLLNDTLKRLSMEVEMTFDIGLYRDGKEFIDSDWIHSNLPYLIILDGMMPKMDGIEVLQNIRALQKNKQYKVIMLTTRKSEMDISRALELGADDYITKPFSLLELEARIKRLLK